MVIGTLEEWILAVVYDAVLWWSGRWERFKNSDIFFSFALYDRQTCFKGKNEAGLSLFMPKRDDLKMQI